MINIVQDQYKTCSWCGVTYKLGEGHACNWDDSGTINYTYTFCTSTAEEKLDQIIKLLLEIKEKL